MANTTKPFSEFDANQIQMKAYNPAGGTMGVDGFIVGMVGRKITRTLSSSTTEDYSFYEGSGSALLYTIRITYTDSTLGTLASVERIA